MIQPYSRDISRPTGTGNRRRSSSLSPRANGRNRSLAEDADDWDCWHPREPRL